MEAVAAVTFIFFYCVSRGCDEIDNRQLMNLPVIDCDRWCDTLRRWI
jgi:hypothetical protein